MSEKILFVDDEQSLLNGIERRLGSDFDVSTANSGAEGLELIESEGPFAVIFTDMRMPKMDGLQFLQEAQEKAPDSVYIMLSGNQDQTTAVNALNQGRVFRFLTKPCQGAELAQVVEAGLRQYQLVTGEKDLLQKTFAGAVGVLTDVLELTHPEIFGRTHRILETVQTLQVALGLPDSWEYKLAARLGMLGFAMLPDDERAEFEARTADGTTSDDALRRAASIGQRLIERIPRLETVAKIIGSQADVDGSAMIHVFRNKGSKIAMGATLLRVSHHWDDVVRRGLRGSEAVSELRRTLPCLANEIADCLSEIEIEDGGDASVDVAVGDLEPGMVLYDDVLTSDGALLIRKGRRLTWSIIERLRSSRPSNDGLRPILVRESSIPNPEALVLR